MIFFFKGKGFLVPIFFCLITIIMYIVIPSLSKVDLDDGIIISISLAVASIVNFIADRILKKKDNYFHNTFMFIHMNYWSYTDNQIDCQYFQL
jgi:hypothetical protein